MLDEFDDVQLTISYFFKMFFSIINILVGMSAFAFRENYKNFAV